MKIARCAAAIPRIQQSDRQSELRSRTAESSVWCCTGTKGIGLHTAVEMLELGATVAITARSAEGVEAKVAEWAAEYGADRV